MTSRVKTVTRKVELRNVLKRQTAGQRNVIGLLKLSNTNFFLLLLLKCTLYTLTTQMTIRL